METTAYVTTHYSYQLPDTGNPKEGIYQQLKQVSNTSLVKAWNAFDHLVSIYQEERVTEAGSRNRHHLLSDVVRLKNHIHSELESALSNINTRNKNIEALKRNKDNCQRHQQQLTHITSGNKVRIERNVLVASDSGCRHLSKLVLSPQYRKSVCEAKNRYGTTKRNLIQQQLVVTMLKISADISVSDNEIKFNMARVGEKDRHLDALNAIREAHRIYQGSTQPLPVPAEVNSQ